MDNATTDSAIDPDALCDNAQIHHQAGRLAEAETLYRQILQIDPGHPGALYFYAGIAYEDGRHLLASELLTRLLHDQADDIEALHLLGLTTYKLDSPASAIALIRRALALYPNYQQAHYSLGDILQAQGELEEAVASFQRAVALNPQFAEAYCSLGNIFKARNQPDEAISNYQRALHLNPGLSIAHRNLGETLHAQRHFDSAIASYRQALDLNEDSVELNFLLGKAFEESQRQDMAMSHYRRALALQPDFIPAHLMLASMHQQRGELEQAIEGYRRAVTLNPEFAEGHFLLGNALAAQRQFDDAEVSFRRSLSLRPTAETYFCLGSALHQQSRRDAAMNNYKQALQLKPDHVPAQVNLATIQQELGQFETAIAGYRRALALQPAFPEVLHSLANALKDQGKLSEALDCYRQALTLKPDYVEAYSSYLLALQYLPNYSREQLLADHVAFADRFETPLQPQWLSPTVSRGSQRRLKVGLVSGDLHNHPVGFFLEGILRHIDPRVLEIALYSTNDAEDELTARLRALGFAWTSLTQLADADAALCIRNDNIDILVDLSGHTGYNRLLVFARKPAPLQVTWLGYWATTGLRAIDYILCDRYGIPEDERNLYIERPWYLPDTRLCFTPPTDMQAVQPPPALRCGYITFGCFNNLAKMSDAVVALWAQILKRVANARLLLKSAAFSDEAMCRTVIERYARHGISSDRLVLEAFSARSDYFAAYHRVDIALDPFPFTGATTSVEGLWMGVPLITLRGDRMVGHQGESILRNMQLPDWIASDEEDYATLAIRHARDPGALAELRAQLRPRLLASPLCNAAVFARHLEGAFQQMWADHQTK